MSAGVFALRRERGLCARIRSPALHGTVPKKLVMKPGMSEVPSIASRSTTGAPMLAARKRSVCVIAHAERNPP
jgi:hypothetical protein